MKLLLLTTMMFFFNTSIALSYIDDKELGEAETLAGDQNTNLYRLNTQGTVSIKKLKQVNELIMRREASGKQVFNADIEDLLNAEKKDKDTEELKNALETVDKNLSNPRQLKIVNSPDIYKQLAAMHPNNVRDKEIAVTLSSELKSRRKR